MERFMMADLLTPLVGEKKRVPGLGWGNKLPSAEMTIDR